MEQSRKFVNTFRYLDLCQKGERELQEEGKLLAVKWYNKREVHMLTTEHIGEMIELGKVHHVTNQPTTKLDCVIDYSKNMQPVDKTDTQISVVECVRQTVK